jgi:6-phosphofructokinase 1
MKRIGVLTSGGDGPGLNPCIRAVTRTALGRDVAVSGIEGGFEGLMNSEMTELTARSVGGILGKGGTFLGTTRSPRFKTAEGQREALRNLNKEGIEGLVVIGGNGSLTGALALHKLDMPVIGIPATIDNDIGGTDIAIGVDTTLNTILDAVDKIKDTASSHQRAFLIEVMGRNCGYLALHGAIAGGAEAVLLPEVESSLEELAETMVQAYVRGKSHCIVIVAEGFRPDTREVMEYLGARKEELGFDVRLTVLGHVQRGGRPSAFDRLLATRLGLAASRALLEGDTGNVVGLIDNEVALTPLEEALANPPQLEMELLEIAGILAR